MESVIDSELLLLSIGTLVIKYKKSANIYRDELRKKMLRLYKLYMIMEKAEKENGQRRFWVRHIFTEEQRHLHGASNKLIREMYENDGEKFFNFFRMTHERFTELLGIIAPKIKKQDFIRESIHPEIRLQLTLRYLASGDSMASMQYQFRVGKNTVSKIISETCQAIWDSLVATVFMKPSQENWKKIAKAFEEKWNFKNCIGAIDGKHVVMQALPNSGSTYYNYKGTHSINLMAIADAHYQFIMVDLGGEGRQSDSGIFKSSQMGQGFQQNLLDLPPPEDGLPYVLVGDEAFPLTNYLMRPYPRSGQLDVRKKIFNYRLSRARRVAENTFGIFVARFRIFRKPIIASDATLKKIVQASVCLHNYIQKQSNIKPSISSDDIILETNGLGNMGKCSTNTYKKNAANVREKFTDYFCGSGAVDWQWQKALQNDF